MRKIALTGGVIGLLLLSGCQQSNGELDDGWVIERIYEIECSDLMDASITKEFLLNGDGFFESARDTTNRDGWLLVDASVSDHRIMWSDAEFDHSIDRRKGIYRRIEKTSSHRDSFRCEDTI